MRVAWPKSLPVENLTRFLLLLRQVGASEFAYNYFHIYQLLSQAARAAPREGESSARSQLALPSKIKDSAELALTSRLLARLFREGISMAF